MNFSIKPIDNELLKEKVIWKEWGRGKAYFSNNGTKQA